nr:GntR family transcriptional regulator [Pigmentiphaga aceris]
MAITAEDEAYRHLHAAIRTGRYRAGERLVPEVIAVEIGTSRMPVREAFRRLAADGLITIRPNRGAVVSGLNVPDMQEVFEMRAVLEGLAARLALPNLTSRALDDLERMLDRLDSQDPLDTRADWASAHREFHEALCALSDRPRLARQISGLHVIVEPYMRLWKRESPGDSTARDDHRALMSALHSRDPDRCERAAREHVMGTVPELMRFLLRTSTSSPPNQESL